MKQEQQFLYIVEVVPLSKVSRNANIANSHVIYKLKSNDDKYLSLKAWIAPHGNEDNEKVDLTTDCITYLPAGFRVIQSLSELKRWKIKLGDAKAAFVNTGEAKQKVYLKPQRESKMFSSHLWILKLL